MTDPSEMNRPDPLSVKCPKCGAEAGEKCVTTSGYSCGGLYSPIGTKPTIFGFPTLPHAARVKAAKEKA